jgi:hypothetical protein
MLFLAPFQPAPDDYPNHLAAPQPQRLNLSPAPWLLVGLVLLCLAPRVGMAWRIPSVCPDGVLYIKAAKALEAGNFREAFREMSLNIYPAILMLLHRTGLDWESGAAAWGVVISSLAVLPLWGWVRRQFDDRVALVACLLYAVHSKFIEWSPEVMRDQTFWFLFMLSVYWLWRAVVEVHFGYFIAAGAGVTLASLTRTEGLFLLIPFALWVFWRLLALQSGRRKLLVGAMLCVVVFPVLLALVNLVWLCGHANWTGMRLEPLARVQPWLHSLLGRGAVTADSGDILDPAVQLTFGRMLWVFFPTATRGLSSVFALLMFGGLWGWRRVWARRDQQPLFYMTLVILCGIWVQLWFDKNICPRYMLPIVLMASPFAALGLLGLVARLMHVVQRLQWGSRRQAVLTAGLGMAIAAFGWTEALTSNKDYFQARRMLADTGRWLGREHSNPSVLVGQTGIAPIVSYYARSSAYEAFNRDASNAFILGLVTHSKADVVILQPWRQLTGERCASLVEQMKQSGLELVSPDVQPSTECAFYVLVQTKKPEVVQKTVQRR